MQPLTAEMILVMAFIGVAVFLFVVEWVRVDVVAILIMVALPLAKLVTPAEAFSGLSSNAVVSIIAVIIIGAGLDKTGLVNNLVSPVLRIAGGTAAFYASKVQPDVQDPLAPEGGDWLAEAVKHAHANGIGAGFRA